MSKTSITYKNGDYVLIRSEIVGKMGDYFDSTRSGYLGKTVQMVTYSEGVFYIESGTGFRVDCIERKLTLEEVGEWEKRKAAEVEAIIKSHQDVLCTPDRVGALAIDIFGVDRVDVWSDSMDNFKITILFPELTLTNSSENTHTIKDLYVIFDIKPTYHTFDGDGCYKCSIKITGRRGKLFLKEYDTKYCHSHLPPVWTEADFCLGSSAFRLVIEETMMEMSEDSWMKLFLSLPNYVKWESLEGGPHMKIQNIAYKNSVRHSELYTEVGRLFSGIPMDCWDVVGDEMRIVEAHPDLIKYFNDTTTIRKAEGYTEETYAEAVKRATKDLTRTYEEHPLIWKGKKVVPEIIIENVTDTVSTVDRVIIGHYCRILGEKGRSFLKQKSFKDAKNRNQKRVFGETGAR